MKIPEMAGCQPNSPSLTPGYRNGLILLFFTFLGFGMFSKQALGQTISGTVSDQDDRPLPYAHVILLRLSDSTLIKGVATDETGNFEIRTASSGEHHLKVSLIGYKDFTTPVFHLSESSDIRLPKITLSAGIDLEEVTVAGTRPLFEQKSDRLVINVQSSEMAVGSSASEILGRSPGIQVNAQNNAISINGRTGANIMVNGRMLNLPPDNVVSYLQGINANSIESIEVLTNPPANADAQGNAGFINIILKQGQGEGFDGSVSTAAGIGTGLMANSSATLNLRKKKWALSSTYNLVYDERDQGVLASRNFTENNDDIVYETRSIRYPAEPKHNFSLSADYQAESFEFGVLLIFYGKRWVMDARNIFTAARNGIPEEEVLSLNYERNYQDRIQLNSYVSYTITEHSSLDINLNYIYMNFENPTTYDYTYSDGNGITTGEEFFKNFSNTDIDVYTASLDYHLMSKELLTLDLGVKLTQNGFTNDFEINEVINDNLIQDPELTNISTLEEYIYAGYVNAGYRVDETFDIRAGLRYEYTDSELTDIQSGPVVDRTYGYFFPSISLNYTKEGSIDIALNYTERINRPSFLNMAPFFIFLDPDTFITGNPSLQPSTSKTINLNLRKGDLNLRLDYFHSKDPIANFTERYDTENNRNLFRAENLDYQNLFRLQGDIPLAIGNNIKLRNTIIYEYNELKDNAANFGRVFISNSIDLNTSLSVNLQHDISAEVMYKFNGPKYGAFFNNVNFFKSYHEMNLSIQKQLKGQWGTVGFKLLDIFNDYFFEFTADYPELGYRSRNIWDLSHTTWQITYVLNFGQSAKESQKRKTGAEDDLNRFKE